MEIKANCYLNTPVNVTYSEAPKSLYSRQHGERAASLSQTLLRNPFGTGKLLSPGVRAVFGNFGSTERTSQVKQTNRLNAAIAGAALTCAGIDFTGV